MKQRFLLFFEHRTTGYTGFAPDLPGCISTGSTLEVMHRNMSEAVEAYIASVVDRGDQIPQAKTTIVHFPHPSEGHGIDHWVVECIDVAVSGTNEIQIELTSGT